MATSYYPSQDCDGYYWQSAYADAFATHSMLPSTMWGLLSGYEGKTCKTCGAYTDHKLHKYYKTYDQAIRDLKRVLKVLSLQIQEYSYIKDEE